MRLNRYFLAVVLMMLAAILFRVAKVPFQSAYPVLLNFSPVAALSLFGAAYLKNKKFAFFVPVAIMFLSDCILGFHSTMFFTYGSFALISLLGFSIFENKISSTRVLVASLSASLIFFLVTNFGVWLMQSMYAKNMNGLVDCYIAAIPFLKGSLLGDLIFSAALFGAFEWIKQTNWLVKAKA